MATLFIAFMIKDAVQTYSREVALTNKELITLSSEDFLKQWGNFLNTYFPYYRNLDNKGQVAFCIKTQALLKRIDIVGMDTEVDSAKRVLLMASLAQLTFGLKKLGLYNFKEIRLYKGPFHLQKTNSFYEGITYSTKFISLSWTHYEYGIINQTDGVNLGIYHLAEALKNTVNNGIFFDTHFASYIDEWTEQVEYALKHNSKLNTLIGSVDVEKMFPRVAEVFFEKPFELKEISADTYAHTCALLNQNPLNITEDYAYSFETLNRLKLITSLPAKIRKIYRHHQWHWSYNLTLIMPAAAPICFFFTLSDALITNLTFGLTYFTLSIVLLIALYKFNKKSELYSNKAWLYLFCLLGLTPILLIISLLLNNNIIVGETHKSVHKIADYTYIVQRSKKGTYTSTGVRLFYDDDFLNDYYRAREFDYDELPTKTFNHYSTEYKIAKGILGIDVVLSKKLIYTP